MQQIIITCWICEVFYKIGTVTFILGRRRRQLGLYGSASHQLVSAGDRMQLLFVSKPCHLFYFHYTTQTIFSKIPLEGKVQKRILKAPGHFYFKHPLE